MNEMIFFAINNLEIQTLAQIAKDIGFFYTIPQDEIDEIIIRFDDVHDFDRISIWKRMVWRKEEWESEITALLAQRNIEPNCFFLVEFRAGMLVEMTNLLKVILSQHDGIIYPEVVDQFLLDKSNLNLETMKQLYERDYSDYE